MSLAVLDLVLLVLLVPLFFNLDLETYLVLDSLEPYLGLEST